MATEIQGNHCALLTPFTEAGEVDTASFVALIDSLITNDVHGLIVAGTTGEGFSLSVDERKSLAEVAVRAVNGRVPVGVMVGYVATEPSIELARHAESVGADYLLIPPPPSSFPLSSTGLGAYYIEVASAVSLPVMVYDGGGGIEVPLTTWRAVVAAADNIRYAKVAVPDAAKVSAILAALDGKVQPFAGKEEPLLMMLANGAMGMVSATANVLPRQLSAVYTAYASGDRALARGLFYREVLPVMNIAFVSRSEYIQCLKQLLAWNGVISSPATRSPLPPLDPLRLEELAGVAQLASSAADASGFSILATDPL